MLRLRFDHIMCFFLLDQNDRLFPFSSHPIALSKLAFDTLRVVQTRNILFKLGSFFHKRRELLLKLLPVCVHRSLGTVRTVRRMGRKTRNDEQDTEEKR